MADRLLETRTRILMKKHDFRFKKRLGQNFLVDPDCLRAVAAGLSPDDMALEIGPGMGFLTAALAETAGFVYGVELDRELVAILEEVFAGEGRVRIVQGDGLKLDFAAVAAAGAERGFTGPFRIVANLPYYITTPLLFHFLENRGFWSDMTLMVQKEVAERIVAAPGGKAYGVLTLSVAYDADAEILFTLPPTAFRPAPKVESAVLRLTRREAPPAPVADRAGFKKLVQAAFAQRRKTLANALAQGGLGLGKEEALSLLAAAGIDPSRRGETLSFAEFAALANHWAAAIDV